MDGLLALAEAANAAAAAAEAEAHRRACFWGPGIVFDIKTGLYQPLNVRSAPVDASWGYTTQSCDPARAPSQRVARKVARNPCVERKTRLRVPAASLK
jgi:hypothetical protein